MAAAKASSCGGRRTGPVGMASNATATPDKTVSDSEEWATVGGVVTGHCHVPGFFDVRSVGLGRPTAPFIERPPRISTRRVHQHKSGRSVRFGVERGR
jgi:hypothetical protein